MPYIVKCANETAYNVLIGMLTETMAKYWIFPETNTVIVSERSQAARELCEGLSVAKLKEFDVILA